MEKTIRTSLRTYRIEYFDCDDGLYKLVIYDYKGNVHDTNLFKYCYVKGSMAVNLTWSDVEEFFDAVKNYEYRSRIYHQIKTLQGTYLVEIIERANGTYEVSIRHLDKEGYRYVNPKNFRGCDIKDVRAINLTKEDAKAFLDAVKNHDTVN